MHTYLIRGLRKFGFLDKVNVIGKVSLGNRAFRIPIIRELGFPNLFMSETWMLKLLDNISKQEKGIFVDVGANIGQTLLKLRSVNDDMAYVGIEPNAICVFYLSQLIKANEISGTTIIPVGISEDTNLGVLNFFHDSDTDSTASMIDNFRPDQKVVKSEFIPLFKAEEILEKLNDNDISVLKIDVEGAEFEVLSGFDGVLGVQRPIILLEILPVYNQSNIDRYDRQLKIELILKKNNYRMFRVLKNGKMFRAVEEIHEIGIHSDLNLCDYVMVPEEKYQIINALQ